MDYSELEGLTKFSSDLLDAYCYSEVGHTNWSYVNSADVNDGTIKEIIVIYKELDKDENPKSAWNTIVWNADEERPMVWEITQSTIKDGILSLANNGQWGGKAEDGKLLKDVSRFTIEVSKTGDLKNTSYQVNPEPPAGPAPQEIVDAVREAMIDVRVLLSGENNGDPFGALTNDQENIKEVKKSVTIGDGPGKLETPMDIAERLRNEGFLVESVSAYKP